MGVFHKALRELGENETACEHFQAALRMLDGGRWRKRHDAFFAHMERAYEDERVSEVVFEGIVRGWKAGVIQGCERMKRWREKRQGRETRQTNSAEARRAA